MSRKKWIFSKFDKEYAAEIAERYELSPFAAVLLASKNFEDEEELEAFLSDESTFLVDPYELPDMDKAVMRINRAIENFERIMVYGDYDADGVSSTALLYLYLRERGADVQYYIPDRLTEGYGMNLDAVRKIKERDVDLIITVDNGISAVLEAEKIKALGMDLVVTDHHRPGDTLPSAVAVVDPYRKDYDGIFNEWAGVGVAFKLVEALSDGDEEVLEKYADLVSIGTIGDVVPLKSENRAFVKIGMEKLCGVSRPGIEALKEVTGTSSHSLSSSNVAFTIVPRINAAGRMGSAERAIQLLLSEDENEARMLAEEINQANVLRQQTEMKIIAEAEAKIEKNKDMIYDRVLVLDGENWHSGVIGIVAARLTEKYSRPCLVIGTEDGMGKGSGRSIEGFSLFEALSAVSDCLDHFGGHTLAAGFGVETDKIPELRRRINEYAKGIEMPRPSLKIDCRISPKYVNVDLLEEINMLEPFGAGNSQPLFAMMGMKIEKIEGLSQNKHTKLLLSKGETRIVAMRFGTSPESLDFIQGDTVDIAANLDRNEYMGTVKVSIIIRDMRFSSLEEENVISSENIYEKFRRKETLSSSECEKICPDRDFIGKVFRILRQGPWSRSDEALAFRIGDDGKRLCAVKVSLDVLEEMGLIFRDNKNKRIILTENQSKVDLTKSEILKSIKGGVSSVL
ncbi:MAG: single-stranded-DNA-specific exonuclease RecJ [Ruminococcaceae bacterium]|nr:single-stranded-DNA-specific exonuclease RecJ [Oscillospiraceae bacterium]